MKILVKITIFLFLTFSPLKAEVVKVIKGSVLYEINGKEHLVKEGQELEMKEGKICTKKDEATLSLPDRSVLLVKENTCISIEDFEEKPAIFLFFGRIINKVTKTLRTLYRYEVHTLNAVAGVRGTLFSATAREDGSVVFELEEGEIEVESGEHSVIIKPGDTVEIVEEGDIRKRKKFTNREEWLNWLKKRQFKAEFLKKRIEEAKQKIESKLKNLKLLLNEYKKTKSYKTAFEIGKTIRKLRREIIILRGGLRIVRKAELKGVVSAEEIKRFKERLKKIKEKKKGILNEIRDKLRKKRAMEIWESLPAKTKKALLKRFKKWKSLPPEKKAKLLNKWRRWKKLPPSQRARIIKNYKRWKKLTPAQRRRIINAYKRWKRMSPEKRRRIIENYKKFKKLPPAMRKKLLKKFRNR